MDDVTAAEPAVDDVGADPVAPGRGRQVVTVALHLLAVALLLFTLLVPHQLSRLAPGAFVRVPAEAALALVLVLALPWRVARVLAGAGGALLGLLAIGAVLDMGFDSVLVRPFDPVTDGVLVADAVEFVHSSFGRGGAVAAVVGAVLLTVALLALTTLAALRLARLAAWRTRGATLAAAALALAWVTAGAAGLDAPDGTPVAAAAAVSAAHDRVVQVDSGIRDRAAFARLAATDAYRDAPGDRLLTGLQGKDVLVAFVESYGRRALEDPAMAPHLDRMLADQTRQLQAAGFAARSGYLTSPTAGGGSWLAHSTLLSGLWVTDQQRYRTVTSSDRLTLNGAFKRAGWRTVGIMPAVTRAWPEGSFYRFDEIYDLDRLGYRGPNFAWAPMPDQYALGVLQQRELSRRDRPPVMAEFPMVSSHAPWVPVPRLTDWSAMGDGSVFQPVPGQQPGFDEVWASPARVRDNYRESVEYSVTTLTSWLRTYGDERTVLVFLGDHQAAPVVTGPDAGRDVPVTIVAKDPAVLQQVASWGWTDGLRPAPTAPVWRMDTFRDRFLAAFGPQAAPR